MTKSMLDTFFGPEYAQEIRDAARSDPFRPYVAPTREATDQLNVRIPTTLLDRVKARHRETGEPMRSIVQRALEALCDTEETR